MHIMNCGFRSCFDAGVIPAVFMGAAVLRSVFTKRTQSRNRIVPAHYDLT